MEVRSFPFSSYYPFFRYRHVPPRGEMAELFGYIHLLAVGESIQNSNAKRLSFMLSVSKVFMIILKLDLIVGKIR